VGHGLDDAGAGFVYSFGFLIHSIASEFLLLFGKIAK
jgi:hypothetical protein